MARRLSEQPKSERPILHPLEQLRAAARQGGANQALDERFLVGERIDEAVARGGRGLRECCELAREDALRAEGDLDVIEQRRNIENRRYARRKRNRLNPDFPDELNE